MTIPPPGRENRAAGSRLTPFREWLIRDYARWPFPELRDRVAATNQLLLCGIVGVLFVAGLLHGSFANVMQFSIGALIIVLAGAVSLAVPWARIHPGWVASIPLVDIGAIAIMRQSDPTSGLGLLWAFPMMWLSALGMVALLTGCVLIVGTYWTMLAAAPSAPLGYGVILLPAVMVAIGVTTYTAARRFGAQRALIDRQTDQLAGALTRASHQEQLMTEVLDTVDFGVIRMDAGGDITFVNDALGRFQRRIPGFGRVDVDLKMFATDGTTELPASRRPLSRVLNGETFSDEVVWFAVTETRRAALSLTARRMTGPRGEAIGAVLVARDVTTELTALRARDRLVASVSHELRTPLTSILGYLELALDVGGLSDTTRGHIETAYRNSERLLVIVADILAASSSSRTSAEVVVSPRPIDLAEILHAAASDLAPIAQERAITIDATDVAYTPAFADPARIRQVADNLLGNAIKFNRDGGRVVLACGGEGDWSWFTVRDTGIGLTVDDQSRLFERFFRAESGVAGTGLGLSISREIVRAHGGDITVESMPGVGSTFTVRLPAAVGAVGDPTRDAEGC